MIASQNAPQDIGGHTLENGTTVPTGTTDPNRLPVERSEVEPTGNRTREAVPIVPVGSVGSFSEVRRALFGDPASATVTKPLSADGGGEEPATSDDDDCWVIDAESAAMLDKLEEVSFDDVPVCSCGRYCDTQTLTGVWHCSDCDPTAEERRKRTSRLLSRVERIRRENRPSD